MKGLEDSTWKHSKVPRGKYHNQTALKTTVSLYLSKKIVEQARKHKLNLSRVMESALISILDYLEPQNNHPTVRVNAEVGEVVGRPGLEPGTFCVSGRCPNQTRRPARNRF